MSIRLKLIITYAFCVFFSTGVIVLAFVAGTSRMMGRAVDTVLESSRVDEAMFHFVDLLAELKQADDYEEDKLLNTEYMNEINDRLQFFNSSLVVMHGDEFINVSVLPDEPDFYDDLVPTEFSTAGGQMVRSVNRNGVQTTCQPKMSNRTTSSSMGTAPIFTSIIRSR